MSVAGGDDAASCDPRCQCPNLVPAPSIGARTARLWLPATSCGVTLASVGRRLWIDILRCNPVVLPFPAVVTSAELPV